ncbi:MAG: OB-fold nucleic acid binding domain-containing protein, partial [Gammaproteobacteria bacterium]|nr:OB-fold nucleic acid binding domain-containing protein [Gammaproteobacteria bacterium]
VNDAGEVVYGLGAIKGLGEGPIQSIVESREQQGPYKDLFDFCARVDLRKVNKRALEALIRAGALDKLGPNRAQMMASLEKAIARAGQQSRNEDVGIADLFGDALMTHAQEEDAYAEVAHLREWSDKERLQGEKETLGLFLTGHPFDQYEREIRRFASTPIAQLKPSRNPQKIAGLLVNVRTMKNKKGQNIAFLTLDDRSARMDVTLFAETWAACRDAVQKDAVLVVEGEVSHDDYSGTLKLRANQVYDVTTARTRFSKGLEIRVDAQQLQAKDFMPRLEKLLSAWKGDSEVSLRYQQAQARARVRLGQAWRVQPDDELIQGLTLLLGDGRVSLVYE